MADSQRKDSSVRPKIVAGVELRAVESRNPIPLYKIALEGHASATLPATVLGIALLFDGTRTYAQIDRLLAAWGATPPPDFVEILAQKLSQAALVELTGQTWRTFQRHAYQCSMCGLSCCGPEIGPLSEERATTVEAQWNELVTAGVLNADNRPIRRDEAERPFLARHDGKCTFLRADNLCAIHDRFGLGAKPVACQLFPLVAIDADGEPRLGLSGACWSHHESFDADDTDLDLDQLFLSYTETGVRPLPRTYQEAAGDEQSGLVEETLLPWLLVNQPQLAELAAVCATGELQTTQAESIGDALGGELAKAVLAWVERVLAETREGRWPGGISTAHEPRALRLAAILETLGGAAELPTSALALPPERWRNLVSYRLRNHVALRVGYRTGTLTDAMTLFVLTLASAHWYAALGQEVAGLAMTDTPYDRFATALTAFSIVGVQSEDAGRTLAAPAREAMRQSWRAALSAKAD